jgi:regulator of protease activity HflC (stomatin/prohibitin superfamily)
VIAVIVAIAVIVVALLAGAIAAIKIVREYQRVVVFRLGRASGARGPGLVMINPLTDRVTLVDLREQFLEVPHQVAITKDNASIAIDFIIFFKVFDPVMGVLAVRDFRNAALNVAATTLRSVVGDMSLDEVLSKREDMNSTLRHKLDDVTERWGVKVTNVEVREINPPPAVLDAMTRQMSAERTRRAVVTEADGTKQAAITVAEGQKQSAILSAEGERQAAILQAEGYALALKQIYIAAHGLDANTMTLQYLDALKKLGASPSTKFVVPMELSGLLSGMTASLAQSLPRPTSSAQPVGHNGPA